MKRWTWTLFLARVASYIAFLVGLTLMIRFIDDDSYWPYSVSSVLMGMGLFWTIRTLIYEENAWENVRLKDRR